MSSNTKIVVLRSKEVIYTLILIFAIILALVLILSLYLPAATDSDIQSDTAVSSMYIPGVYTTTLSLGNTDLELQVILDSDHINSISFANMSESVATMYPLINPTLDELSAKVIASQSIEQISYSTENKYTSLLILNAISQALEKGTVTN